MAEYLGNCRDIGFHGVHKLRLGEVILLEGCRSSQPPCSVGDRKEKEGEREMPWRARKPMLN